MATPPNSRSGDVQALHRSLDILERIGKAGEIGVSELARDLGMHVSTVHNVLRTLARRHYLVSKDGRYSVGPAAAALSSYWDPGRSLPHLVHPILERIGARCGYAALAKVMIEDALHQIGFAPGPGAIAVVEPHHVLPNPLSVTTGRVLTAFTRGPDWERLITTYGREVNDWQRDRWRAELSKILTAGYSATVSKAPDGITSIAVPVWAAGGGAVAALGCNAPSFLVNVILMQKMLDALWAGAAELSAELGCEELPPHPPEFTLPDVA